MKDSVGVYCCDRTLSYDDAAGNYNAIVITQNLAGAAADSLNSTFNYIAQAGIEVNFSKVGYGEVKPNMESAAVDYQNSNLQKLSSATVRNIGNIPVKISILQDDMGVGKTDGSWNISYKAKINNNDWFTYQPYETVVLAQTLDLGQSGNIDFAVQVNQFPPYQNAVNYQGQMKIETVPAPNYQCEVNQ